MLMLASAIGPVLGGFMSDAFGWRSIFLVNLPIGGLVLPHTRPERVLSINYLGAVLLAACFACLVLWAAGSVGIGLSTYYALFLQSVAGLSPTIAGLPFIPLTGGIVLGSLTAGRIMSRTGRYKPFAMMSTGVSGLSLIAISQLHAPVQLCR